MRIERLNALLDGGSVYGPEASYHVVRFVEGGCVADIVADVRAQGLQYLVFLDERFFADSACVSGLCEGLQDGGLNVLWSAKLGHMPDSETLRRMRLAGCQRIGVTMAGAPWSEALERARKFGFDVRLESEDGFVRESGAASYTVEERAETARRLPGSHAAQFDLAVALFKAGRYGEVMHPLGKAMTLRFPMNELCLNLLACLGAAKRYPDMAAGLLAQAGHGWPHPVVLRNRSLLKSWAASGGDVRGTRLKLEPESTGAVL